MNPNTLAIVIAAVSVILSIFGASWLNSNSVNKATSNAKEEMKELINARSETLRAEIQTARAEFRAEIAPLRTEIAGLSSQVQRLDRQVEAIFKPVLPKSGD